MNYELKIDKFFSTFDCSGPIEDMYDEFEV
jgi:hypothetical protein